MNLGSTPIIHQPSYFKTICILQYMTKIRETGTNKSGISLAFQSIKNHCIPSYKETVLTVLVELCPNYGFHLLKTNLQASALIFFSSHLDSKNPFQTYITDLKPLIQQLKFTT